ncbi:MULTISPECIES: LytTR family DNA-binding domain-containing protein [unclassified Flavobacterium]|jgi:two-component system LytT family response regulator|uniref:LytR/AlgR family response regulator transcription factor n=1 Tax=unclassified Flavobacterium TaxID=196869 RepID=UPI002490A5A2|nr:MULTISPECIES: LytTR family DNA-binding domain-containing protein [unclassified Flavobacterium]MDQ1166482.1 two-component system LytT family response regulator [Flavobacterium sp. SORGH_AS_0622]BDU26959.1 DNA-binding response regulator [Flavobacterium sp. GSB-24]
MTPVNAIIISEEQETFQILKKFEEENAMIIEIIGNADCTKDVMTLIKEKKPDLIFLDIYLTDNLFFEMLEQLEFNIPKLVFISANKDYAVKAFKHDAVDFLLKPIDFNSIIMAIYKVIKRREMERSYQNQKINNINISNTISQKNDYVAVASLEKIELIPMSEITFCKADGKYTVFILSNGAKIMSSRNLGEYSTILDNSYFFRIHHSYIVNLRYIAKISKKDGYFCELSNGVILPIAKRRQDDFNKFIKLKD